MDGMKRVARGCFLLLLLQVGFSESSFAQGATKWVAIGSMHNWYSEVGCEIEHGNFPSQQYGLRWPAQYDYQDHQAAKGFWIGTKNWSDDRGVSWPMKVVHVGPRVDGLSGGEFFPLDFRLIPKYARPLVLADGLLSFSTVEEAEDADPTLPADRVLISRSNTAIGITMERKVYAWAQQYHDNYHILEFEFTNTGNIDGDPEIELPNQTLTDVYFYWQERYSIGREVRYMVNNSAGWGINTMNDARGFAPDIANGMIPPSENDVKAQFAWHGYHSQANRPTGGPSDFNNIGAPIFDPGLSSGLIPPSDTTWRLGAAQFVGKVHLYADQSATNKVAATDQPSTTNFVASDEPITRNNSQFDAGKMAEEFGVMTAGHVARHAWQVVTDGNFSGQSVMGNIGVGSPGGWSQATGYGPYTLAPGQSIKIVFAEGASGLTREEALRIGKKYKDGQLSTKAKSDSVLITGKERILETFRRAVANYTQNFSIPNAPYPPTTVTVEGGGNKISVSWTPSDQESANNFAGYRVYRAFDQPDSTFHLIFQAGGPAPSDPNVNYSPGVAYTYDDLSAIRGRDYYYYVTSFSTILPPDPATGTPGGVLESSRFATQTYDPSNLKRPAGTDKNAIRIVPNPFVSASSEGVGRFGGVFADRIAFYNIPGYCTIRIYTELGELIREIEHTNGTGDEFWNSNTSSNQIVVSGVYIVHITVTRDQVGSGGEFQFRAGETFVKKLIIIR